MKIPALLLAVALCCITTRAQQPTNCNTDPLGNPLDHPIPGCSAITPRVSQPVPATHETPEIDIFGGYSYVNADVNDLGPRQSANGWEASVSGNVYKRLALEGSFSGYYKSYPFDLTYVGLFAGTLNVRDFAYVGGPRVNLGPVFVHAMVGGDHLSFSVAGISGSLSQNSFAGVFGGGVQIPVAPRWAVRASADYVLTQHNLDAILGGSGSYTQNNFRVSAGIVFRWGGGASSNSR